MIINNTGFIFKCQIHNGLYSSNISVCHIEELDQIWVSGTSWQVYRSFFLKPLFAADQTGLFSTKVYYIFWVDLENSAGLLAAHL